MRTSALPALRRRVRPARQASSPATLAHLVGATAVVTALAGASAVPSLLPEPTGLLSARAAVAPVPLPQEAPTSVAAAKAREQRRAVAADAAARRDQAQRASRARRARDDADPRGVARALLAARGQGSQWGCLDRLWTRESEWKIRATNPSSGAYGIPQALPATKLATAGADWRTSARTQIRWGLGYIAERYGSPCAAWGHSQAHGWY